MYVKGASPTPGDTSPKTSPQRERAAYLVSRMVGLDGLVPETVLSPGQTVSVQRFVRGKRPRFARVDASVLELFDYIIANTDRHSGNWFVAERSKWGMWAIDNAYSFSRDHKQAPPCYIVVLPSVAQQVGYLLTDNERIHRPLRQLLSLAERKALIKRLTHIWNRAHEQHLE